MTSRTLIHTVVGQNLKTPQNVIGKKVIGVSGSSKIAKGDMVVNSIVVQKPKPQQLQPQQQQQQQQQQQKEKEKEKVAQVDNDTAEPQQQDPPVFQLVQTLTGTLPGDSFEGDLFGIPMHFARNLLPLVDDLIVGAPGAGTDVNNQDTGAAYFYRRSLRGLYQTSQSTVIGPAAGDLITGTIMVGNNQWLFLGGFGTPLNDPNPGDKDYSGSVLVFQKATPTGQWLPYEPQPIIFNPDGVVAGAGSFFGYNIGYNLADWLAVGGAGVNGAYMFHLEGSPATWVFKQLIVPVGMTPGISLPAMFGTHMLVSQGVGFAQPTNSAVFPFELNPITQTWRQLNTLQGFNNTGGQLGDYFGSSIQIDGDRAVIGALGDSQAGQFAGAGYFYQFVNGQWTNAQKVVSQSPSFIFGYTGAINSLLGLAAWGDPARSFGRGQYQGAVQMYQLGANNVWQPIALLTNANGASYDQLGGGGIQISQDRVAASTDRAAAATFPNIPLFVPPSGFPTAVLPGKLMLWQILPGTAAASEGDPISTLGDDDVEVDNS